MTDTGPSQDGSKWERPRPLPPAFALGWMMAELYRPLAEHLRGEAAHHLPTIGQLDDHHIVELAVAELTDLLVQSRAALMAEDCRRPPLPTPEESREALSYFDVPDMSCDLVLEAHAGHKEAAAKLEKLHRTLLTRFTIASPAVGAAYQLGVTLSDTCSPPKDLPAFLHRFHRRRLATLHGWLGQSAEGGVPPAAASVVASSLEHWASWVEVNGRTLRNKWDTEPRGVGKPRLAEGANSTSSGGHGAKLADVPPSSVAGMVRAALDAQSGSWRGLLSGQIDATAQPSVQAWMQAGESMVRTARQVGGRILRHFWIVLVAVLAIVAGLIYLVFENTTKQDATRIWASIVTIAGGFGITGTTLRGGMRRVTTSIEVPVVQAAEVDARAWAATVLPTLPMGPVRLHRLRNRGVGAPVVRRKYAVDPIPQRLRGPTAAGKGGSDRAPSGGVGTTAQHEP